MNCTSCRQPLVINEDGYPDHAATGSRWCYPDRPGDTREATLPAEPRAVEPRPGSSWDGGDDAA